MTLMRPLQYFLRSCVRSWLAILLGALTIMTATCAEQPSQEIQEITEKPAPETAKTPPAKTASQVEAPQTQPSQPPTVNLEQVPPPNLEGLEEPVAAQLSSVRTSLVTITSQKNLSAQEQSQAFGTMGQMYHAYLLADSAAGSYRNAIRLSPNEFRWIYLLADLYQRIGRIDEAISLYERARALRPDNLACLVNLGKAYLQDTRIEDARGVLTHAVDLNARSSAAHEALGQVALSEEKYRDAVRHFEAALELVPAANRIHYPLAMAYRQLNETDKATAHLSQRGTVGVKVADPLVDQLDTLVRGARAYVLRGGLAFRAGRYEEAAAAFTTAISEAPQNVTARVNLGSTLAQLGQIDAAIEQYQAALQLQPDNGTAHYNLALLLLRKGLFEDTVPHFRGALASDPSDRQAHLQFGHILRQLGQDEEALASYTLASALDPSDEEALIWTAEMSVRAGRCSAAREHLEGAYRRFPHRGLTTHTLAHVLAACPDPTVRDGTRAVELAHRVYAASQSIQHAETVALALAEVGRCEDASKWQRRTVIAATQTQSPDEALVSRLEAVLARYEQGSPCRPPIQPIEPIQEAAPAAAETAPATANDQSGNAD